MQKKQCGECLLEINDLEPVVCGFCEKNYHISQQCCGFNNRACKDLFSQGKAIYICNACKIVLNGRSLKSYIAELQNQPQQDTQQSSDLTAQVANLSAVVQQLNNKVDKICSHSVLLNSPRIKRVSPSLPGPPAQSLKRRRVNSVQSNSAPPERGTKTMDFTGLSVPSVVAVTPPKRFWLYLSGFQPLISTDDVQKIVACCLEQNTPADVVRLVAKDRDVANLSFISFKIGLDPTLKEQALLASTWPAGILFREFVDQSKNSSISTV